MAESTGTATQALRQVGLRVTTPRLAVLRALGGTPHADAPTVLVLARQDHPGLTRQAVYVILDQLTDVGLLRRIQPAGSPARYETRTGDNHHHLVCRRCGDTRDVDCVVAAAPCLTPSDAAGFVVDEAEVVFWGTCPTCQQHGPRSEGDRP